MFPIYNVFKLTYSHGEMYARMLCPIRDINKNGLRD